MKVTKSRISRLIKEELSKAQQKLDLDDDGSIEGSDLKGLRSGKKDSDVGPDAKNENISRIVQEEYAKFLNEGDQASQNVSELERIGKLVQSANKELDLDAQPNMGEIVGMLDQAEKMIQSLWEKLQGV